MTEQYNSVDSFNEVEIEYLHELLNGTSLILIVYVFLSRYNVLTVFKTCRFTTNMSLPVSVVCRKRVNYIQNV